MGTASEPMSGPDWADQGLPGRYLARVRRLADLSQRDLAARLGVSSSRIGHLEAGRRPVRVDLLARALDLAGLRLIVVDADGRAVAPVDKGVLRDRAGRRYPSHHDVVPVDEVPVDLARDRIFDDPAQPFAVRGRFRDERRRRLGGGDTGPADDHPLAGELERRAWLQRRHPIVRGGPRPAVTENECTCEDACFERTCVDTCRCRCEDPTDLSDWPHPTGM